MRIDEEMEPGDEDGEDDDDEDEEEKDQPVFFFDPKDMNQG